VDNTQYVLFKDRFRIYLNDRIAECESEGIEACITQDVRDPGYTIMAVIATHNLPVRMGIIPILKGQDLPGMLRIIDYGVVQVPARDDAYPVIIYERPMGGLAIDSFNKKMDNINENAFISRFVAPLCSVLTELGKKNVTTRGWRPGNIYFKDAEQTKIAIGDFCLNAYGINQPTAFETVESALCSRWGRGLGAVSDDIYSFAATMLALLLGRNPLRSFSDEEIINMKSDRGSFTVMAGETQMPIGIAELLRACLNDNADQRWGINSVDLWLGGRRLTPLASRAQKYAQRPLKIGSEEYYTCRDVSMALHKNWHLAAEIIKGQQFDYFIKRGIQDNDLAKEINRAMGDVMLRHSDNEALMNDALVARVCFLLDPKAPLYFKELSFFPDAIGIMLAAAFAGKVNLGLLREAVMSELGSVYILYHSSYNYSATMKNAPAFVKGNRLGDGMERALYEINENFRCISPMARADYVNDIRKLLGALEKYAVQADRKNLPVDHHIVAFVAKHFLSKSFDQIEAINHPDEIIRVSGTLSLLALLQWYFGPDQCPSLTAWMADLSKKVIGSYHNKDYREELLEGINQAAAGGSLVELYHLVDNSEKRRADEVGFMHAKKDYMEKGEKVLTLQEVVGKGSTDVNTFSQQIAALIGILFVSLVMIWVLVAHLFKG